MSHTSFSFFCSSSSPHFSIHSEALWLSFFFVFLGLIKYAHSDWVQSIFILVTDPGGLNTSSLFFMYCTQMCTLPSKSRTWGLFNESCFSGFTPTVQKPTFSRIRRTMPVGADCACSTFGALLSSTGLFDFLILPWALSSCSPLGAGYRFVCTNTTDMWVIVTRIKMSLPMWFVTLLIYACDGRCWLGLGHLIDRKICLPGWRKYISLNVTSELWKGVESPDFNRWNTSLILQVTIFGVVWIWTDILRVDKHPLD